MARRLSSVQKNTLFQYFTSPKSEKKAPESPQQNGKDKTVKTEEPREDEDIVQVKKRSRIAIVDSDSEDENSVPYKPTPKKRKNVKSLDSDDEKPDNKRKSLQLFAFDKTNVENSPSTSSKAPNTPKSVKKSASAAPASRDVHHNWLHNNLDFLKPENIRDINKNRPEHPDYDYRTLFVPKAFLEQQTPAMRQWWVLKGTHMDSILFFKVGKFYELYHMDAVVGVTQLGFSYMKGDFAHSGFPETAYYKMANALIEKGYKVARTEQTETPEMMAERCKKQGKTTKFDKVVKREICQISTKATCVYSAQLPEAMHSLPCYMYAICEKDISSASIRFGICFVDTSIGTFHMSEFDDDKHCSRLLALFAEYPPGLILTERCRIGPKLKEILNTYFKDIRKDTLGTDTQFYSASRTIEKLREGNYFLDKNEKLCLPEFITNIIDGYNPKPEFELTLRSLGACIWYLEDSKLDIQVVSMGKFEMYHPFEFAKSTARDYMILDSVTITNLNLLGGKGSLQKTLDHCQTAFGRRMLQQWICRPLCNIEKIIQRQKAIKEIFSNPVNLQDTQRILKKLPDLERQVAKIHSYGNKFFAKDHPDSRAIFYEAVTYSKRRINDLLRTLQGFEQAQEIATIFKDCQSPLLKKLTQFNPKGMYVDLTETLDFFKGAFDQEQAMKENKIIPKRGVDDDFDESEEAIEEIKRKLDRYLKELQKFFGCKVSYFGSDKKRFQIEIPESHSKKVTHEYQLEGAKKGAKRYSTPQSRQFLADMIKAESERTRIIQDLNRRIFEKFSHRQEQWEIAIQCLSTLDVLCSLAEFARSYSQDVCIPDIEPIAENHKIKIKDGRHPCVNNVDNFVPNDTSMGIKDYPSILLLTGPNMGGKSTLMRQVAIICVMAQMGGFVPATSCELNLIDRIFTRLGAQDDIIQGQSTFLVELSEASSILQHASPYSLVLLDELGRGTSTHDGNAIATAYVKKLTQINCRTLFSTHYHSLVDHFINRDDVQLGHMACMVENDEDPTEESVTFLYKVEKGRCPKSYGFNVARLAGLKHCVVARGREIAKELEEEAKNRNIFSKLFSSDNVTKIRELLSTLNI